MDRTALIQEAIATGLSEEVLIRAPTYTIVSMISEKKNKNQKKLRKEQEQRQDREGEIVGQVQNVVDKLKESADDDIDETATVVDMQYITTTNSPSDQKYKRFSSLVAVKNDLVKAITNNSMLLQDHMKHLDADDVLALKREIEQTQHQLKLVNCEIRDISQWFKEIHAQQHILYQQLLKKSSDMTGNLSQHFQRKMENIQRYMEDMQNQARVESV